MDDEALRRGIIDALVREPTVDAARIGVTVENGIVILTGNVDDRVERIAAAQAARRLKRRWRTVSSGGSARSDPSDDEIDRRVRTAIAWHRHAPERAIGVQVADGWVRLTGTVEDPHERRETETAVAKLDGVVGISNLVEVAERSTRGRQSKSGGDESCGITLSP